MNDPASEKTASQNMEEILREVRRIIAENDLEKSRRAGELAEAVQESVAAVERASGVPPSRPERAFGSQELRRSRVERAHPETFMEGYVQPIVRGDGPKKSHRPSTAILMIFGLIMTGIAAVVTIISGVSIVGLDKFMQLRSVFGGFLIGAGLQAGLSVLRVARHRIADPDNDAARKRTVMDLRGF